VPPSDHPAFYSASRYTLNVTRADMVEGRLQPQRPALRGGRLRHARHLRHLARHRHVLRPESEIVLAEDADTVLATLCDPSIRHRDRIARAARARILSEHTADHRAAQLIEHLHHARLRSTPAASFREPELQRELP
jgi:spore maturation protein CgeB